MLGREGRDPLSIAAQSNVSQRGLAVNKASIKTKKFLMKPFINNKPILKEKAANVAGDVNTTMFSITTAFRHNVLTEAMITLGNSLELPVLFRQLG